MYPGNCLFSDNGKLGIRRDHPHRRIKMKVCMVDGFQELVLRFEFQSRSIKRLRSCGGGRNLSFLIDLAIGL